MSLITTWHPTYAFFHNPYEWGVFDGDLQRFSRLISGKLKPRYQRLIIEPKVSDLRAITAKGWVTVDVETGPKRGLGDWTGKDPTLAQLRTVGFGNDDWALSWDFQLQYRDELVKAVVAILTSAKIVKVFHNGWYFDIPVLSRFKFPVRGPVHDTRDMRRALSRTSPLKLAHLASVYNDTDPWKEGDEDDDKGLVFTEDRKKLRRYNAQDCFETAVPFVEMQKEPEWQTKRVQNLYRVHTRLSKIAAKMFKTGFRVDQAERKRLADVLLKLYEEREADLLKTVGIPGFKCHPNSMRSLIYKRHETKAVRRFSLRDPIDPKLYTNDAMTTIKVDQSALLLLLVNPDTPPELKVIIEKFWHAESAWKARATYIVSRKVEEAIGPDGRLRAGWNSCGTDTMRWSCSRPNLMNLSEKKDEDGGALQGDLPSMRSMYVAAPGKVLVHPDWSQLELRVMAAVARDEELARRLVIGDVYSADAKDWFKLPHDMDVKKLKPAARKQSKIIHLASQYAAGTDAIFMQGLEQDRGLKFETTRLLHAGFKRTYHRTVAYWSEEMERVAASGYSEGRILFGRRYYPRQPPITEVANYPIQSTAGELANLAMIEIDEGLQAIKGANIITQLHDAFDVECWKQDANDVAALMKEKMEQPRIIEGQSVVFPVEIKIAERWSDV